MTSNYYYELIRDKKVATLSRRIDTKTISQEIALYNDNNNNDEPFLVMNLSSLIDKYSEWKNLLPNVRPYYAVKCNDDEVLLKTLSIMGSGFDCASKNEINKVISMGISTENIVYANPCKTKGFITHAKNVGVNRMTFDNCEELNKVKDLHNNPQMILRIAVSDPTAQCPLGVKFGCDPETVAPKLLEVAKELNIPVIGVSFHVGSGCHEPKTFDLAIMHAKNIFDYGKSLGHKMYLLDIGGGFPGVDTDEISFDEIASVINHSLEKYKMDGSEMELIAEPGRFFASAPISVTTNIISSVQVPASRITNDTSDNDKNGYMYYMNDGVYGSFNCKLFDHYSPKGEPLFDNVVQNEKYPCTIWGPTCDGLDQVEESTQMRKMHVGEWLHYPNMGAYTSVASSNFNGFEKPKIYHFIDELSLKLLNSYNN